MTFSSRTLSLVGLLVVAFALVWIYLTFFGLPPEPSAHGFLARAWQLYEWPFRKVLEDVAAAVS